MVQRNEEVIKGQLKELVWGRVEETLNELLEQEAEKLAQAARAKEKEHPGCRLCPADKLPWKKMIGSANAKLHIKGVFS